VESHRPRNLSTRWQRFVDRSLVLLLLTGVAVTVSTDLSNPWVPLVGTAQVVPLWWRRYHPTAVFVAVAVASAAQVPVVNFPLVSQFAFVVAVYSTARWSSWAVKAAALVVSLCAAFVASWSWLRPWDPDDLGMLWGNAVSAASLACTAWALGIAGSQRDRLLNSLVERAEQAERMAERDVALAAQDERARIAREMHDVVAHGLSVIVVQADGARYAAAKDPQVAVSTLETVADAARGSLQEMRRLLGLLRTGDSGVRPQPVLGDVPHLVEEARAGGMDVRASWPDPLPEVGGGVGLAVYRLVQEALTNVRKHAGPGAHVEVDLRRTGDVLEVEVADDGRGAASDPGDGGLGIVGMRERMAAHGGTLQVGPVPGGGWRVQARVPL